MGIRTHNVMHVLPKLTTYEWLILFYININMFKVALRLVFGRSTLYTFMALGLEAVLLLGIAYHAFFSNNIVDLLLISYIYIFSLLLSIVLNPRLSIIATDTIRRFITCIEGYYLFSRIKDTETIKKLIPYCVLLLIPYCYIVLSSASIDHYDNSDYFTVSYGIILPICMILIFGYDSLLYFATALLGLFVVLYAGARGAFVCVAGVLGLFLSHRVLSSKGLNKILILSMIAIAFLLVTSKINQIVDLLYHYMPNSRTIARLVSGAEVYDSSRLQMYNLVVIEITNHPLIYRGILSDRLLGSTVWLLSDTITLAGTYAHNLFLEILYDHGVILGSVMLLFGAWCTYKSYRYSCNYPSDNYTKLFIILFGCSIIQLMYSSSYLINYHFWCLFGFVVKLMMSSSSNKVSSYFRENDKLLSFSRVIK